MQAHRERGMRNFSTVEQEKNHSIDKLVEQQSNEINQRQSFINNEKQRLMSKIKQDLKQTHLIQIEEKKLKSQEEQSYNKMIEG